MVSDLPSVYFLIVIVLIALCLVAFIKLSDPKFSPPLYSEPASVFLELSQKTKKLYIQSIVFSVFSILLLFLSSLFAEDPDSTGSNILIFLILVTAVIGFVTGFLFLKYSDYSSNYINSDYTATYNEAKTTTNVNLVLIAMIMDALLIFCCAVLFIFLAVVHSGHLRLF